MIDLSKTGVYCITNTRSGLRYVGSAAWSFAKRWSKHKTDLRRNVHSNQRLQNVFNKYGAESLVFTVLRYCEPEECLHFEQLFMDHFESTNKALGYNMAPKAGHTRGMKMSEATKRKMSLAKRGKHTQPLSAETKARISAALTGRTGPPQSDETRKKQSLAKLGKPKSLEAREKMSAAKKGRRQSDEVIARQAESRRGRKASQEHRDNISRALKGKPKSAEHRRHLAEANLAKNRRVMA